MDNYPDIARASPMCILAPAENLTTYLKTICQADDTIGYASIHTNHDGTMSPDNLICRKAGDLLASLDKYPDDLGATIGDRAVRSGAMICFNAPDHFDNAAINFQGLTADEQMHACADMRLPVVGFIGSGDNLQINVRIGAKDAGEYKERLNYLTGVLKAKGYTATCNPDPAGYVLMPGSYINGSLQSFITPSEAPVSWEDWKDSITELISALPPFESLSELLANPPELPEELIEGVLRRGHKMILSGPSKVGKTFTLMELSIAIACGRSWLGFPCRRGNVLYVNLEVDKATFVARFNQICNALGIVSANSMPMTWNLRGYAVSMEQLTQEIIKRAKHRKLDAIILDPFYKLAGGDENSASDMIQFVRYVDTICTETGAAVIYAHHHSKSSADRRAIDRASGTTVFARDPDSILDMVQLIKPEKIKADIRADAIPLRMDFVLREFASPQPINLWFDFPLHRLDVDGDLTDAAIEGGYQGQKKKRSSGNNGSSGNSRVDPYDAFATAFNALSGNSDTPVKIEDLAARLGVTPRTVRDRIKSYDDFVNTRGIVTRKAE